MAVRVKVNRVKLLKRINDVKAKAQKEYDATMNKYERDRELARKRIARELRTKANLIEKGGEVVTAIESHYTGRGSVRCLAVESELKLPKRPEERRDLADLTRIVTLLEASDDETISVNVDDMKYYGIGTALLGMGE